MKSEKKKSQLTVIGLTFLFGPFGLLYINIWAFVIMLAFWYGQRYMPTSEGAFMYTLIIHLICMFIGSLLTAMHNQKIKNQEEEEAGHEA